MNVERPSEPNPRSSSPSVALVTGAAQGVGLGIAQVLSESGYRVALADVDARRVRDEAETLGASNGVALALVLDVSRADDWDRAVAQLEALWGRLDLLVNNAGISPRGTPESVDEALWDRTLAVNLKGPYLGIRRCLPLLRGARGAIVNIGSTRATRPRRGLFAYGVSKAGLLGLTRQVAVDCLDDGITCNMVAPGWVDTPGERALMARHGRPDFPRGVSNLLDPREIGEVVRFLATPAGRKINGDILYVDSGLHCADDVAMIYKSVDDSATHGAAGKAD